MKMTITHTLTMRTLFLLFLALGAVQSVWAQGSINGTVKGAGGEAVPFATVEVVGAQLGAITDKEGKFGIADVPAGSVKLRVSSVGYATTNAEVAVENGKAASQDFSLASDALGLTQLVVTGVRNDRSKLESSVSISTLNPEAIQATGARTTAEIFRSIPGIRSEASGGEGNANITARGVPVSSGGAKYLQLQEDGLPVMLFGDMSFATADIFLRADQSVNRIEAIRGGSASTFATNSPAGLINFISNTGATRGGSIATTFGVDYNNFRTDFNFGSPLGNDVSFHVGGFFRQGEGQRTAGYTSNLGGQIKANLTKKFKNGYARIYYKYLNDRAAGYLPMPIKVEGTNANPTWSALDGYDPLRGALQSPYLLQNAGLGPNNESRNSNVADGMHPNSHSVGAEFSFDLDGGWKVEDRARMSLNSGSFVAPFPVSVATSAAMANSVAGTLGLTPNSPYLTYAGTNTRVDPTSLAVQIHMFDTQLNNFDNMVNDLKVAKRFGKVNATVGYFTAVQNVNMSWLWNSYITELNGSGARLLDLYNGTTNYSQNGLYAYGVPAWGNCCQRNYNAQYATSAPYANLGIEITKDLNFDGSVRWDIGRATGTYAGTVQAKVDVNHDGVISPTENSVSTIDNAHPAPINYTYNYVSYSLGANYKLSDAMAIFARHSHGGAAKADRILFGGDINSTTGGLTQQKDASGNVLATARPYDLIDQTELGWKYRFKNGGLFITGFHAGTDEAGGYEATTQKYISNNYDAYGLEIETALNYGAFNLTGGLTFTQAKITKSADATVVGNTPRRQAAVIFNVNPSYRFGRGHSVGASIIGTSSAFTQDENKLVMPGYAIVNLYANFAITKSLFFGLSGNNIFNALGLTESEDGHIVENQVNYVRARPIFGRSINASVRYVF